MGQAIRLLVRVTVAALLFAPGTRAEDEAPDLDFLAYLGSWQENDEEWLAVAEWEGEDEEEARSPPAEEKNDDEKET
jgi:hypothetical protein